jgi:hypothetical protein
VRFRVQESTAARVEIDLPHPDGRARTLCLTDVRGASASIENSAGRVRVRGLRGTSAVLDHFEWPLARGGRIHAATPAGVAGLSLELDSTSAPKDEAPVSGRATLTRASARAVSIEIGAGQRLVLDIDGKSVSAEHSPERIGHAAADRLDLSNLQTAISGWLIRASGAAFDRARADWRDAGVMLGAAAAHLAGVTITRDGISAEIDRVELPEGVRTSGRALVVPVIWVPEMRASVDDILGLVPTRTAPPPERRAVTDSGRFRFDFGFLDRITGRLDVDLTMAITVPVIGKREATHHFRVPIVSGVLNYRELERDLASVEDAFIDLEVRGQTLALERSIPILGMEKPLIVWELSPEELELAKKRLARLRTVPRMQIIKGGGDKGAVAIRRVRFDDIDIELTLAPAEDDEEDAIGRLSVANLKVKGQIHHDAVREVPPTSTTVSVERVGGGPFEIPLGKSARLEVEAVEVGGIEAGIEFRGFKPGKATAVLKDLVLRNVKIVAAMLAVVLGAGSAIACGADDDVSFMRPDARPPIDAGPAGDARLGVDCFAMGCAQEQACCYEVFDPPDDAYFCVPDEGAPACDSYFDCDGPEDCASGLCCGGINIQCAPPGATRCPEGATVCHQDADCAGPVRCCPTPTGVVKECITGC